MLTFKRLIFVFIITYVSIILISAQAFALTAKNQTSSNIATLIKDELLEIKVIQADKSIVAGQEISIIIELSSIGWFASPTQFTLPIINNAIVKQRNKTVEKSSFEKLGNHLSDKKEWNRQRFEFSVFPQQDGRYQLPSMQLILSLSMPFQGISQGVFSTPTLDFIVKTPLELQSKNIKLATISYKISSSWDKPLTKLNVGDAITRTITQEVQGLFAMMLPEIKSEQVDGLSQYKNRPELWDYTSGGSKKSQRITSITYIVERSGHYIIPPIDISWWHTSSAQLRHEIIAEEVFQVASIGLTSKVSDWFKRHGIKLLLAVTAFFFLVIALIKVSKKKAKSSTLQSKYTQSNIIKELNLAIVQQNDKGILRWLYRFIDWSPEVKNAQFLAFLPKSVHTCEHQLKLLFVRLFSDKQHNEADRPQKNIDPKSLIKLLKATNKADTSKAKVNLLNPK